MIAVDAETAIGFSAAARRLCDEARLRGLVVPGFRSPPRLGGVERTLRRIRGGTPVVAVTRRGRSGEQVLADMIDGVVVANRLSGDEAERLRSELRRALARVA